VAHWKVRIIDLNGLEGRAFFAIGRCFVDLIERIEFHHPVKWEASLHEQAYQVWDELLRYAVSLAGVLFASMYCNGNPASLGHACSFMTTSMPPSSTS
jgi:hypothetical protein